MRTQTAFGYDSKNKKITRFDNRPVPTPKANEVLLRIEAAGLCLSDPHLLQAGPVESKPPLPLADKFVMGHEIAGQIVEVGSGLKDHPIYKVGGRFAMLPQLACGYCISCRKGLDTNCLESRQVHGLNEDGGFQSYLLVKNVRSMLPIPDGVSYEVAAVSTDSVLTPFHAIQKVKHLFQPTSKVLVQGCGGLGLNAVQIIKQFNCHIVATDAKPDIEAIALEAGANEFYTDLNKSAHAPRSFDIIFDFVGIQPTFNISDKYIKKLGTISMIGLGRGKLLIPNYPLSVREVNLIFNHGGTSAEQIELMDWIKRGLIKPNFHIVDFEKLPQAIEDLVSGKVTGRVVFKPNANSSRF
ncbi:uncharacterized protein J8A68_005984 [[Candida] subhashii]|uniref:Enoyl reductase (ER) domain-containing protein n=1 Tax=[Candida] subhashii TaxID=561895 RepID=A0A8J5QL85_9ASCO|nr:uncharacterized protein J8A68_005984 [[Candida] subhashii]KAG7660565.1 hypothetical protein J8A68_005984 [[Candida] subhashii]